MLRAKESKDLWIRLSGYPDFYQVCLQAVRLCKTRDLYDYNDDVEKNKSVMDVKTCKSEAKYLMKKLEGLK